MYTLNIFGIMITEVQKNTFLLTLSDSLLHLNHNDTFLGSLFKVSTRVLIYLCEWNMLVSSANKVKQVWRFCDVIHIYYFKKEDLKSILGEHRM